MVGKSTPYFSYLLRLWQADNDVTSLWRCSLENVQTGDCQSFVSLMAMLEFLETTTSECEDEPDDGRLCSSPEV
jgi:hypothetical protein